MKNLLFVCSVLFLWSCGEAGEASEQEGYLIKDVSVISMMSENVVEQDVYILDGVITDVTAVGEKKAGKKTIVINGSGKFLIPGLTEMHGHVPGGEDLTAMKDVLEIFVLHGITTVRSMLGNPHHLTLKQDIMDKKITGPLLYTSAPGLTGGNVISEAVADSLVRQYASDGYDHLKILPGISLANFRVIEKTAKEIGIPFAGHVPADVGVWNAIAAGYATIDHLDGFVEALVPGIDNIPLNQRGLFGLHIATKADESRLDTLVKALKQNNIWVVPTEALPERWFNPQKSAEAFAQEPEMKYMDPEVLQRWINSKNNLMADPLYDSAQAVALIQLRKRILKACHDNGVGILAGCDAPQVFDVPGYSTFHELKYMQDAGLSAYEVLQTATTKVAEFYKIQNGGTIQRGAPASVVLLNSNPLDDIMAVADINTIFANGVHYSPEHIKERLKALEGKIKQQ